MKKMVVSVVSVLICILLAGCGFSGSEIQISSKGAPEIKEKTFAVESDSLALHGRVSAIGNVELKILAADDTELYAKNFEDVRNEEVSIEVALSAGKNYTLILNGQKAVSFNLSLSSDQKLLSLTDTSKTELPKSTV